MSLSFPDTFEKLGFTKYVNLLSFQKLEEIDTTGMVQVSVVQEQEAGRN